MPSALPRRDLLSGGSTLLTVLLAGCSTLSELPGDSRQVRIGRVSVTNSDDQPRTFDILIRDRETDEIIFWETYTARAMTDWDGDETTEQDWHSWENPVSTPGKYVVHARAVAETSPSETEWESKRLPTDVSCLHIDIEVGLMGQLSISHDKINSC